MASKFHEDVLKIVVGQICQNIGFHGIFSSSVDVLVDLLHRYLRDIAVTTHRYTEHCKYNESKCRIIVFMLNKISNYCFYAVNYFFFFQNCDTNCYILI